MIKIFLILFFIPLLCLSEDFRYRNQTDNRLPNLNITNYLDSVVCYTDRFYSPDKTLYLKSFNQSFVADSDIKAIISEDFDTTRTDYKELLKEAEGFLKGAINEYIIYDSSNKKIERIDFVFRFHNPVWLKDYLIINNTKNRWWPIYKERTEIIAYNYQNKKFVKYKARNLTCIGQNDKEMFFIIDSAGYIDKMQINVGDIVSFDTKRFNNITNHIKNRYFNKIPIKNTDDSYNLSRYIEYYNGYNIIFSNDTNSWSLRGNNLKILSHLPKSFTIINDSLVSLKDMYLSAYWEYFYSDSLFSVLLKSVTDREHCVDLYILNENGLKLFLKLSDLIILEKNEWHWSECYTFIYYISDNYALLELKGNLANSYSQQYVIIDIKQHKIIATPKIIEKRE